MTLIAPGARTQLPVAWAPPVTAFSPLLPRVAGPLTICCIGTSITFGTTTTDNNSYRGNLYNLALAAGLTLNFIGRTTSGTPGMPWVKSEGVIGSTLPDHMSGGSVNTVGWLAGLAPASRPQLLIHELGINDSSSGPLTAAFAANMSTYIAQLEAIQPFRHCWAVPPNDYIVGGSLVTIQNDVISVVPTIGAGGTKILYVDGRWLEGLQGTGNPAHYEQGFPNWLHPSDSGHLFYAWAFFSGLLLATGRIPTWAGDQNP